MGPSLTLAITKLIANSYNLKPHSQKDTSIVHPGDLRVLQEHASVVKGRGRKSDISNAQLKAWIDIADGKQKYLDGELRAVQALEWISK